ncbi:hypothetical protein [Cellvibrio japonicus]|uniref:Uncharacterized protein n=1 Tax=Cellvibrio japonicus (strain Ueda107) TaxID=498211 RepID=B3PKQ5_CELJU|nr:hypothetical protein [Cellvibrio japonicus]ACE83820.1 conserved hypothetical protein [Cellvibrio japonicus Ueda107]QEI11469.1 hypothetical protein FY117_03970 [Cellvibrio japonicus]QEI15043.1 hypothetical protein FY116_03970 [Cellvibrio japonicus]QEI18623.1 hypothetical protein FY115_03970 [Cellvibrio japonicus]
MELKEFIASTLGEIQEGVQLAINETIKNGVNGVINPSRGGTNNINASLIQNVNFDIAVTVADEEKAGVKGGIKVVGISVGGEDTATSKTSRVSRIQFSIPVIPPVTTVNG